MRVHVPDGYPPDVRCLDHGEIPLRCPEGGVRQDREMQDVVLDHGHREDVRTMLS